jgi:hypothetical protein
MLFALKVSTNMTDFIIKRLPYDLSSHAGLAFIGKYLKSIKINSLIGVTAALLCLSAITGNSRRRSGSTAHTKSHHTKSSLSVLTGQEKPCASFDSRGAISPKNPHG